MMMLMTGLRVVPAAILSVLWWYDKLEQRFLLIAFACCGLPCLLLNLDVVSSALSCSGNKCLIHVTPRRVACFCTSHCVQTKRLVRLSAHVNSVITHDAARVRQHEVGIPSSWCGGLQEAAGKQPQHAKHIFQAI
jgi:hypothetical protein